MPSPSAPKQAAPGKTRKITPSTLKTVEPATPLGVHDNNFVRDRIRQWQSQGGGVVIEPDVGAIENQGGENATPEKPLSARKARASSAKQKDTSTSPKTPTKKVKSTQNTPKREEVSLSAHSRTSSAPAKRVVSDAHWRLKRSPPRNTAPPKATQESPESQSKDDGIRVTPLRSSERKSHPRRKSAEKITSEDKADLDDGTHIDDGIQICSTHPSSCEKLEKVGSAGKSDSHRKPKARRSHRTRHSRTPSPQPTEDIEARHERRSLERFTQEDFEDPMDDSISQRDLRSRSMANGEAISSAYGSFAGRRASARSRRSNLLSQAFGTSKKLFVKPLVAPLTTPRIPSIEAWLDETPDPFVETEEAKVEPEPSLRCSPQLKDKVSEIHRMQDSNAIWEALDTKEGTRRHVTGSKKKRRVPSSSVYEGNPFPTDFQPGPSLHHVPSRVSTPPKSILDDAPNLSPTPSSLRRRGAKRNSPSPTRSRSKSLHEPEPQHNGGNVQGKEGAKPFMEASETADMPTPLQPPSRGSRRPIPTTGAHPLSTIASISTLNSKVSGSVAPSASAASEATLQPEIQDPSQCISEEQDSFDPTSLERTRSKIAKHSDLISVLSMPKADGKSIRSARSIRTNRSRLATATVGDLMKELGTDEEKYMRELRTLVDGVIPVLLTCVLSKSASGAAAGLFNSSNTGVDDPAVTKPIIDMGVALERLRTLHRRIPYDDPRGLMTWAHGAQRVYSEYIRVWRMGFQDVVVNLAPAADDAAAKTPPDNKPSSLDKGLPRNSDGDIVNGDGERVDVAYLLKRPLVRLKYLQKTVKGINFITPSSEAEMLASKFQGLVNDARNRSNEEKGRLEDEAASNIDSTRARDLRTMAPLAGVRIDRTRHVRARDNFNLSLQHSSGQRIDCRAELILRDDVSGPEAQGDLLICEVEDKGRWLLYPPVLPSLVSARNGDKMGEVVVMIRGFSAGGAVWQELLTLRAEEEQVGFDWLQLLGLDPVPPKISRSQSFISRRDRRQSQLESSASSVSSDRIKVPDTVESMNKSRTPSPREIDIPIGEQAHTESKQWTEKPSPSAIPLTMEDVPASERPIDIQPKTPTRPSANYVDHVNDLRSLPSSRSPRPSEKVEITKPQRTLADKLGLTGTSSMSGLRRTKAKRASKSGENSPQSPRSPSTLREDYVPNDDTTPEKGEVRSQTDHDLEWDLRSPSPLSPVPAPEANTQQEEGVATKPTRPTYHRAHSSVPSEDPPSIPKIRREKPPVVSIEEPDTDLEWPEPEKHEETKTPDRLTKKRPVSVDSHISKHVLPPQPVHRSSNSVQLKDSKTPVFSPAKHHRRRSSSPLKHEYEPSTASESDEDSDASTIEHNVSGSISDISSDDEFDQVQIPAPLVPLGSKPPFKKRTPPGSVYSGPQGTLAPSNSASQAPYKTVPSQPTKANKTIATIFAWSDKGSWEHLHPDECSITITPGLIEAHEMSSAHSKLRPPAASTPITDDDAFSQLSSNLTSVSEKSQPERPLIALELTPHVTLRHGTAIDICVRSPPTPASRLTVGTNNIMFRSRNPEECEALYALLNHARIHNPTYIALMNARPREPSFFGSRPKSSARSSWFGGWGRSNSYRANSNARPASVAQSDSSVGTMASTFSALKRFKPNGGGLFNISRSTVTSRVGGRANSIYSSSDSMNSSGFGGGSSNSGTTSPGMIPAGVASDGIGLSGMKIRFYERESSSKWREMGSARLTIMRPPTPSAPQPPTMTTSPSSDSISATPSTRPSSAYGQQQAAGAVAAPGYPQHMEMKRILVQGKTKGETLLDVTLGENCFERVARTGIAVYVWEDVVGPNGELGVVNAVGGVVAGRARVYMIQMKSEIEAAYTFSLVGKLRY